MFQLFALLALAGAAHADPVESCAALLAEYVQQPDAQFQPWARLGTSLRTSPMATIAVKWRSSPANVAHRLKVGLATDLTNRAATYLTPAIRLPNGDVIAVMTGERARLLDEAFALNNEHGGLYLSYQILAREGGPLPPLELRSSSNVVSFDELVNNSRPEVTRLAPESGLTIYDTGNDEVYFVLPNALVTPLHLDVLGYLNTRVTTAETIDWAEHRRATRPKRYAIRLPKYTVFSSRAFFQLRVFARHELAQTHLKLDPALKIHLRLIEGPEDAFTKGASRLPRDAAAVIDALRGLYEDIDFHVAGSARAAFERLYRHRGVGAAKLKLLPNDALLVLDGVSKSAAGRVETAWTDYLSRLD